MITSADRATSYASTLVYDADCGFCTVSSRWIERRFRPGCGRIVPWQQITLAEVGLSEADVDAAAWWIRPDGRAVGGHLAIAAALVHCRFPWSVAGRLIAAPPLRWVAGPVYRWIARNRHRMPGGTSACRI